MELEELKKIIQECGVVGAGGAGFPTYAKFDKKADTILLNVAECELLLSLHRELMERHADQIMEAFHLVAETVGAEHAIIGIKGSYDEAVEAIRANLDKYPEMDVHLLPDVYPMGDEVVLTYECTGRVIEPGGLPIQKGVIVFNVETMYNVYHAIWDHRPVADKLVSVVGEVRNPMSIRARLGMTLKDLVREVGGETIEDPVYVVGGAMMGVIKPPTTPVTKTTNAVLVLPKDHPVVVKKQRNASIDLKRAASICCQCQTCTDLCPRHNLGHPIDPARFMRSASNADFQDMKPFLDTFFCCSCGVCELYACPQDLAPRTLIGIYKGGLRKNGVRAPKVEAVPVRETRELRKVPEARLMTRMGLAKYDVPSPKADYDAGLADNVKILMSQHIGAPAVPIVKVGQKVKFRDTIAKPGNGLSVAIAASIDGTVTEVTDTYVCITADKEGKV